MEHKGIVPRKHAKAQREYARARALPESAHVREHHHCDVRRPASQRTRASTRRSADSNADGLKESNGDAPWSAGATLRRLVLHVIENLRLNQPFLHLLHDEMDNHVRLRRLASRGGYVAYVLPRHGNAQAAAARVLCSARS